MEIFLGVDGGANKTFALATDRAGRVIGFGQAGCANHQVTGLEAAIGEIEKACRAALGDRRATYASFCLAGADIAVDFAMLRPAIEGLRVASTFDLRNDTWAAMRAGTTAPWGVVVICGSGLNAAVRAPDGREFILPNLGWPSGDHGGGGDISRLAIGAIAREWDGRGPATMLTERILKHFDYPNYETLLEAIYTRKLPNQRIYEVARLVFEAAFEGDAVAQDLVMRTGTEIGHVAGSLLQRMQMHREACNVVTGGSIFKAVGPLLMDSANLALHRIAPLARFTRARVEPVVGALMLAYDLHGYSVDEAVVYTELPKQLHIDAEGETQI
mgnify:CR=1 FL=1